MPEVALLRMQLSTAADEFLEEGYTYPVAAKEFAATAPEFQAEAAEKLFPERKASDGFFAWLNHLVWLEGVLEVCPTIELTAGEVEGIRILRNARTRFLQANPPCPACGMPNARGSLYCRDCLKEIKR